MSEATKAALDAAIAAHVADECDGGTLTGYVFNAQYQDIQMMDDGETGYYRAVAERQGFTTTVGLTHYMWVRVNALATSDE